MAIAPEIMAALIAANQDVAVSSYGNDPWSSALNAQFSELFETEVVVFPVATGSAANALALSVIAPPFGAIYCHENAHIHSDECGAPEFYTGGAKLVPIAGPEGKIRAGDLERTLVRAEAGVVHHVQPAAVSLTQATEAGTVYKIAEVQAITEVARSHGLKVHLDGARFANAVAHLGCSPAEITWKAGVDVLSFGATKNGAMAAEAVVFFDPRLAESFAFRRKRGGHLFAKMRFLSAQLAAYITDHLWLRYATHANHLAQRLATGLASLPGVHLCYPVEANEVFVWLPDPLITLLHQQGFQFYRWQAKDGSDTDSAHPQPGAIVRLVTAFNTLEADVDKLVELAHQWMRAF